MGVILHILNVADWALIATGVAITLLMMAIGNEPEQDSSRKAGRSQDRRPRRKP